MTMNLHINFTEQLLSYLLINYNQISSIGLMNGKMGGIIFFMLYAKKTGIKAYSDYCDELFEDIHHHINVNMPIDLYDGLCGIGWGIEFLVQNQLVHGNTDEILEDIDRFIMERNPERMIDRSFEKGLGGVLFYVVSRLKSYHRDDNSLPFDDKYLNSLLVSVNRSFTPNDNLPAGLVSEFNQIMRKCINYKDPLVIPEFMYIDSFENMDDLSLYPIGITGLTGIALKIIMS